MTKRNASATIAIVIGVLIIVALAGALMFTNESLLARSSNPTSSASVRTKSITEQTSATPSPTASSTTSEECYEGALPSNSSAQGPTPTNRVVINVTEDFDTWTWTSLSGLRVGSYTFATSTPASAQNAVQLEPQLFVNVTNSDGQTQSTSVTNLGGLNGQMWPPDMSLEQTLFGGGVAIQWLFLCNGHSVFLEITTQ